MRWSVPLNRLALIALILVLVGCAFAAGWFISLAVDDDDQRLSATRGQLANANGQVQTLEDELQDAEDRAADTEQLRADLELQVKKLTGEESSADLGLPENVKVTSKGKTLKLEELDATLVGYEVADTVSDEFDTRRADGKFLTATVAVTNRLDAPQSLDPEQHFSLLIGGQSFTPDFDAMNYAGGDTSWLNVGLDDLQPGTSKTGTVTFDVSPEAARRAASGVLLLVQFSDASGLEFDQEAASLPVAGLRLK